MICILLAACSGIKHLPPGEKLYTGMEIKLETEENFGKKEKKRIIANAKASVRPVPNKVFLGLRPRLWMYMAAGEHPASKFERWLKKTGEAPVLISDVKPGISAEIMDARLFNSGIFKSYTGYQTVEKEHKASVIYTSHIHKPYTVKALVISFSDDSLHNAILSGKDDSFINPGKDYNLDLLKSERMRIDALLKNRGYFYFNPDYLIFKADTSEADRTVTFRLTLKEDVPESALTVYRIGSVTVNQNYSLNEEASDLVTETLMIENVLFQGGESMMNIRPEVLLKSVYLKKNEIYSRENYIITLNRLMSTGNFKIVQVKFSDRDTTAAGFLDVTILLTPMPRHTFSAELDLVNKSNNYTGPRMSLSLLSRNIFGGGELLKTNMAGSFESQLTGESKNLYAYSWNPELELTFPRFLVPFRVKASTSIYIPKTRILLSYDYMKRASYFDMRKFSLLYGFLWKEDIRKEHAFNPVQVSFTAVRNQSPAFKELLATNPFLKKSYEEQFIAGGSYSFTYNEQVLPLKKMQYFMLASLELAGNTGSLVKMISGAKISPENPSKIAGSVFSQYVKMSLDGRGYYNFSDKSMMAMRIFAGAGKPYGNSSVLPYSRQFFSGGPNSIRAFQISSLGPGTYNQGDDYRGFLFLGGDIKLEMNAEYRFTMVSFFKGALFVDAGNVWLQKSNPSGIGTPFSFSGFMDEVAVGAGTGLRIDVKFFLIRFDLAVPLRKPWLEENHRWVTNQISFGNKSWRSENLVFNVAIGYPF